MEPTWGKLASHESKQTALRHKMASRRAHESQDEPSWSQNWPCRVLGEQKGRKEDVKREQRGSKKVCGHRQVEAWGGLEGVR